MFGHNLSIPSIGATRVNPAYPGEPDQHCQRLCLLRMLLKQEQTSFGIGQHPLHPLRQSRLGHGAARDDGPGVGVDVVQLQGLARVFVRRAHVRRVFSSRSGTSSPSVPGGSRPCSAIPARRSCCGTPAGSLPSAATPVSLLFLSAVCQPACPRPTSSSSSFFSSSPQSSSRARSVASTTQISVSVRSK
jgi:hypothetical protein